MSTNNSRNCVCFSLFGYVKIERLLVHFNVVVHFIFGQQRGRKPAAPYQFFEAIPYKKSMYYAGIPTKSFTNPPWPIFKCSSHGRCAQSRFIMFSTENGTSERNANASRQMNGLQSTAVTAGK